MRSSKGSAYGLPYALYLLGHLVLSPFLGVRSLLRARRRGYSGTVRERLFGGSKPRGSGCDVLLIAGGLGEARVSLQVADELERLRGVQCSVLVQSKEAFALAREGRWMGLAPFNNPLSAWVCLRRWRPRMIWAVEFWDNHHMKALAHAFGIPTLVFNVPITEAEADRVRSAAWKFLPVDLYAAQEQVHADRLLSLGVPEHRVLVTGPVGLLQQPEPSGDGRIVPAGIGPVVLAGSTYEADEEIVLPAFELFLAGHPKALFIMAPRRLNRPGGSDSVLIRHNIAFARRSLGEAPQAGGVLLLDTYGELKRAYAEADVAFIGGTYEPHVGGHTPVEALAYRTPITLGPYFAQQRALMEPLIALGYAEVCPGSKSLAKAWGLLVEDTNQSKQARSAAAEFLARGSRRAAGLYDALLERTAE